MAENPLEYLSEHRERLALVLLRHCRILAGRNYGWNPDHPLPEGKDPQTIVEEIIRDYRTGKRRFSPDSPIEAQLKEGIRSRLWALHQRKGSKALSIEAIVDANGDCIPSDDVAPDVEASNNHDEKILYHLLRSSTAVRSSKDLKTLVTAMENGADDVTSQAARTGFAKKKVYVLRRTLKTVIPTLLQQFHKEKVTLK